MSGVEVSVAICTHNRAGDLELCLAALAPQLHAETAEILVIDSASNEMESRRNAAIVERYPHVRMMRLSRPGLSIARNAALDLSQGTWVAFLDDDTVPDADWMDNALRLARDAGEDCAIVAGDVRPMYPEGHSEYVGRRWEQLLSLVAQPKERDAIASGTMCGANLMIRRSAVQRIGGFPPTLGRHGKSLISGEEKFVQAQLAASGWKIMCSNRLRVGHRIPAERLTREWVSRRAYWDGVSDERIAAMFGHPTSSRAILAIALRTALLGALSPLRRAKGEYFIRFAYNKGRMSEWAAKYRRRPVASDVGASPSSTAPKHRRGVLAASAQA